MSDERNAFLKSMEKRIDYNPTDEDIKLADTAEALYNNLHDGTVKHDLAQTLAPYIHQVLPELSIVQSVELIMTVHTLVITVLCYLIEDGLIKED